jgi:hypothetical protein
VCFQQNSHSLLGTLSTPQVVHLSRYGKPVAVLLSEQAYAALQGHQKRPFMMDNMPDLQRGPVIGSGQSVFRGLRIPLAAILLG